MTTTHTKQAAEEAVAPLTRTERRQQRTRANLVAAIRKLTAEKGVDALTIRDIAEEADIAMGSFYNHFESKEALLNEAVEQIVSQSAGLIDAINAKLDDPLEIIATAFATFDGIIQNDPILGWFIVRVSAHNPELSSTMRNSFFRDVNKGIDSGQFSVPNVSIAVDLAGTGLLNFSHARLSGRADEAAGVDFIHLVLRLLGAEEQAARSTAERVWKSVRTETREK